MVVVPEWVRLISFIPILSQSAGKFSQLRHNMGHSSSEDLPSTKLESKVEARDDGLQPEVSHAPGSSDDLEVKPKVHFNIWACLGVNFSITATPIAIGTMLALAIGVGGPPFFFYEYLFAGVGQLFLCVAMAEVASAIPHSTGMFEPSCWIEWSERLMASEQVLRTGFKFLIQRNWDDRFTTSWDGQQTHAGFSLRQHATSLPHNCSWRRFKLACQISLRQHGRSTLCTVPWSFKDGL